MMMLPPGLSTLPVMAHRALIELAVDVALVVWSILRPHWMVAFLALAYMRAAATISSASTQQTSAAFSGVHSAAASAYSSKP